MSNVQIFTFHFYIRLGFQYFSMAFPKSCQKQSKHNTNDTYIYEYVPMHSINGFIEYCVLKMVHLVFFIKFFEILPISEWAIEIKNKMNQSRGVWWNLNKNQIMSQMITKKVLCMCFVSSETFGFVFKNTKWNVCVNLEYYLFWNDNPECVCHNKSMNGERSSIEKAKS